MYKSAEIVFSTAFHPHMGYNIKFIDSSDLHNLFHLARDPAGLNWITKLIMKSIKIFWNFECLLYTVVFIENGFSLIMNAEFLR